MKKFLMLFLVIAVLSVQTALAAGEDSPVALNPIGGQTVLHTGGKYRFYFTDADGKIPEASFWEGCTLEAELDPEEEREFTETFEIRRNEEGQIYLAVRLNPEYCGLYTLRYRISFENPDGERWFGWYEASALYEPADTDEDEVWIQWEEDCWPRDYDDDSVQLLNFTRQEVIFADDLDEVTLHFGSAADYTVRLEKTRRFDLGYEQTASRELREALGSRADEVQVLDFTGQPVFESEGTLTIRSDRQRLYLWEDGDFVLLSEESGGEHTVTTSRLGCYVLTDALL